VIFVSIKRAGIVLSVFLGWLFFKERDIVDRAIAASVMFAGVLMLYIPLTTLQTLVFTGLTLLSMAVALYATRDQRERLVAVLPEPSDFGKGGHR